MYQQIAETDDRGSVGTVEERAVNNWLFKPFIKMNNLNDI